LDNIITIEKVNKRERNLIIKEKIKNKEKNQQKMHGSPICNIAKFWHPSLSKQEALMLY
jgi:hypothetical protein